MHKWLAVFFLSLVNACAPTHVKIDKKTGLVDQTGTQASETPAKALASSTQFCRTGQCSVTPVLMLVMGKDVPKDGVESVRFSEGTSLRGFTFAGMIKYDGRIQPHGPKYLAFLDLHENLVCQGYYSWTGFGRTSEVKLRCFEESARVTGKIRNAGRQTKGPYKNKGVGTGMLAFDGGLIGVVYGVDPRELKEKNFKQLWVQYGGKSGEIPFRMPPRVNVIPLLNKGKQS